MSNKKNNTHKTLNSETHITLFRLILNNYINYSFNNYSEIIHYYIIKNILIDS